MASRGITLNQGRVVFPPLSPDQLNFDPELERGVRYTLQNKSDYSLAVSMVPTADLGTTIPTLEDAVTIKPNDSAVIIIAAEESMALWVPAFFAQNVNLAAIPNINVVAVEAA